MFTVVWAFQLLFSYCPISQTDHLLSPSCRALIACSKANWAESANWQFIRRRAPPKKEIWLQSQNLRSRGYPWVPPVRTWIQAAKNPDPHNQPRTPTQLDVLKAIKVNLLSLNLGKGMLHCLLFWQDPLIEKQDLNCQYDIMTTSHWPLHDQGLFTYHGNQVYGIMEPPVSNFQRNC